MADLLIGKITHFFGNIMVAVLDVEDGSLNVGDTIKIVGHGEEFQQAVDSMQVEHESIQTAEKGMSVGLKVTGKVN
ncbi:MAG: EF-Tu/IF-2/RF-3 family GTPase, partial [Patescibacteria group bacterium]